MAVCVRGERLAKIQSWMALQLDKYRASTVRILAPGRRISLFLTLVLCSLPVLAHACEPRYPAPATMARMFDMALKLEESLGAVRPAADVVLVARGGQDLRRFGLTYSHLALALRDADGRWGVVHELNRCKTDRSDLYREGLVNFVGESVLRADILVIVPAQEVQARLRRYLAGPDALAKRLHEPEYSMLAHPFSTRFQNSNQWVLEVTAAAMMPEADHYDRAVVQSWLRESGYEPGVLHIKWHERVAARLLIANIATIDHPARERLTGDYQALTVDSVVSFLERQGLVAESFTVSHDAEPSRGSEIKE